MDLSKQAKTRRDSVEAPLWAVEKLLDDVEKSRARIEAAIAVWPETQSTLQPALSMQEAIARELTELQEKLSCLWEQGFASKWKDL